MTHALTRPGANVGRALRPVELAMAALIAAVGSAALAVILGFERIVDWPVFAVGIAASFGLIGTGAYARARVAAPRLALCAIGLGIFMGFTAVAAIFIFSLFPLPNPLVDAELVRVDAVIGYSWAKYMEIMSDYPAGANALRFVYNSSLVQVVTAILLLGATGRETSLHRFLLVGILGMIGTIAIWWVWPSVGPSGVSHLSPAMRAAAETVFDAEYGVYLRQLVAHGPEVISPDAIVGVVGFPSYHMIMACMVTWFARRTFFLAPAILLNLAMVPAALLHGEHHLIDIIGGIAVFFVALKLATILVPNTTAPQGHS